MALFGGLFKLLAAGEAVEGVTGARTLLGKTMEHAVIKPLKSTIIQGLGGNPAQEIRTLASNLKDFKNAILHPVQELNRRYDFFNLSVQDYIRVPTLNEQEFRVDAINQNDPIRSINKIHASIIQNLNVVNKNTIALFDYTRKSVSAQDDKIDEITKIQDKNQKTHDDLERRYTRLSTQIKDLESSRGRVTGMSDEDDDRSDKYKEREHEGIWDHIKDLLKGIGEGALGLYGLKKLRQLGRGGRRGGRIQTRTGATEEHFRERERLRERARGRGRPIRPRTGMGQGAAEEALTHTIRRGAPGFLGRVLRQAGRGGAIGTALGLATELKQADQRDTDHSFRSSVRQFFGIHETEEERDEPSPWNRKSEESSNAYSLKKQNILMESMTDIKFSAISNLDVKARRINLKASDSIVFDAPKIVFTSHPEIRQYEKGGPGRGKPVQTLKTRALSPEEVSQQALPSELYSPTPMTPGGGIGGFSGGGGSGAGGGG
ncbi:MAG TPA: hypothetical protein VEP90_09740, partial [Methylomirabilota bacterium]|nr:hypothetical protein [Methylomirabilota bacterium]